MSELNALLPRACRIFLARAYPEGTQTVPANKRAYLELTAEQDLAPLLGPPVGQTLKTPEGGLRGYTLRLGSAHFPHLKLQVVRCGDAGAWVLAVDTHDRFQLSAEDPGMERWRGIQQANQLCKSAIERAWDADGLLTFQGLLRRETDTESTTAER
jgi:hypothetical protein